MDFVEFWTLCSANNIVLDMDQIEQFKRFHKELIYWNEKVNLISRKDMDNILERHFIHSLTLLKYLKIEDKARVLDIGTGGGFPGIPLSIAQPKAHYLLADSIAKKIKLTEMFAKHTGNKLVKTYAGRVENLVEDRNYLNSFDIITARAVTRTHTLIEFSEKLLKKGGVYYLLKGGDLTEEINVTKDMYPNVVIKEIPIDFRGVDWFKKEDKKILVVKNVK